MCMPLLRDAHDQLPYWLFATSFSMFLFVVPVVMIPMPFVARWYSSTDLVRMIDPFFTVPVNMFVWLASCRSDGDGASLWEWIAMMVAVAVYVQGHGIHETSNMLKRPVDQLVENGIGTSLAGINGSTASLCDAAYYSPLMEIYTNSDRWEHIYGHYMYAIGAILISWCHAYAHRFGGVCGRRSGFQGGSTTAQQHSGPASSHELLALTELLTGPSSTGSPNTTPDDIVSMSFRRSASPTADESLRTTSLRRNSEPGPQQQPPPTDVISVTDPVSSWGLHDRRVLLRESKEKIAFVAAVVFYTIILAGVAIEFPAGTIVALCFLCLYGLPLGLYAYRRGGLFVVGSQLVLQFYVYSYFFSLWIVVIWMCVYGTKNRASAGIKTD